MLGAVVIGVAGFMIIEHYNFADAIYMTIITISTVGYNEIHPLSQDGRIFASLLILSNIGVFFYSITTITAFVVDGDFQKFLKIYRVNKAIDKLENHVVICGYGRNGKEVALDLHAEGQPFIIIENNPSSASQIKENGFLLYEGDATDDEVLHSIKLQKAKALITTLPKDADNVFVVLTAREINEKLNIIARASLDASETKLRRAGADHVIMPEKIGGKHMAHLVTKPDVVDFVNILTGQEEHGKATLSFEEIAYESLPKDLQNKSLIDLDIRNKTGAHIIGMKTIEGEFIINPSGDSKIVPKTKMIMLGTIEEINACKAYLQISD